MKTFPVVLVAFYAVVYGVFSVKAERIDEKLQDQSKLKFSSSDKLSILSLVDQLNIYQYKLQVLIKPKIPRNASVKLESLQLTDDLADSTASRTTDLGIFLDDLERFGRFQTAIELVTNTSCDVKVKAASRKLDQYLGTLVRYMRFVLRKNSFAFPPKQDLSGLKGKLDKKTKDFLTFFGTGDKKIMVGGLIRRSVLNNVRNYVILRVLRETVMQFQVDFGHLTRE